MNYFASGLLPGATYYLVARIGSLYVNGAATEPFNAANWSAYAASASAANAAGDWSGTLAPPAGADLSVQLRYQAGAAPQPTDPTVSQVDGAAAPSVQITMTESRTS